MYLAFFHCFLFIFFLLDNTHSPFCLLRIHDKHLQTVLNICKAYVRIIVEWKYLYIWVDFFLFFGNSSSYYMIWKASKWLEDEEEFAAMFGMMQDFSWN